MKKQVWLVLSLLMVVFSGTGCDLFMPETAPEPNSGHIVNLDTGEVRPSMKGGSLRDVSFEGVSTIESIKVLDATNFWCEVGGKMTKVASGPFTGEKVKLDGAIPIHGRCQLRFHAFVQGGIEYIANGNIEFQGRLAEFNNPWITF